MIDKSKFQNLKGRRIYQFWLDEETGEITDVTSRDDYMQVVRCKDCKKYKPSTTVPEYGLCSVIEAVVDGQDFCSWAERKDEYVTLHHEDIHFIDEDAERAFYESLAERKAGEHLLYIPLPHKSERILEKDILAKGAERKEE